MKRNITSTIGRNQKRKGKERANVQEVKRQERNERAKIEKK